MGLRPAEPDPDAEIPDLRIRVDATWVAGDVEARDAELTAGARDLHNRIQHGRRHLLSGVITMAAGLETDAIDGAIDLRDAEDLGDLVRQRSVLTKIDDFTTEGAGLRQALWDHVANDDDGGAQEMTGCGAGQTYGTG